MLSRIKTLEQNQKLLLGAVATLAVGGVGYLVYQHLLRKKEEERVVTKKPLVTTKKSKKEKNPNKCYGVLIAGPPGAGKGTQCALVIKRLGYTHISTGDLLREEVKNKTEIGKLAEGLMASGKLVPDDVVIKLVKNKLGEESVSEGGWLLDGFPRTVEQAKAMRENNILPDKMIVLDVPEDILVDRITGRRLDPVDNKIYHIKNDPPPSEEVAMRLTIRPDDTKEKLMTRLEAYRNNIELIKQFYDLNTMTNPY